jgi:MinD-like ATPase involved in chromosome partitioning or flagellar assembly
MYIVTFYSFKGGTGRTLAMVNVGAELARSGARVLLVDFDLEAPSLMSFNLSGTKRPTKGLVDFVLQYKERGEAPSVEDFICESESFPNGGRLWIMPAGSRGADYPQRLMSINWRELYEEQSGYLLFEDLKAQWQDYLRPDYVLIDSRTGHNEVMGICTRQLPDAVCAVFLPNRQNLGGLVDVVQKIRAQGKNSEGRPIRLHFAASNVPYTDDERGTLATSLEKYRESLGVREFDVSIHHDPHLALLGQEVFVLNFPKIGLTQEYRELSDRIRSHNLEDRSSAIKYLQGLNAGFRNSKDPEGLESLESRLREIAGQHSPDSEVCYWLARAKRQLGATKEAAVLIDQSIALGTALPQAYLERASLRLREPDGNRLVEARDDFLRALDKLGEAPNYRDVAFTVRSLVTLDQTGWEQLAEKPAIRSLKARAQIDLTMGLDISDIGCEATYHILHSLPLQIGLSSNEEEYWRSQLGLACIRLQHYAEAASILCAQGQGPDDLDQPSAFNVGMALWGERGEPDEAWFKRVLALHDSQGQLTSPANYFQCLGIAAAVCKDNDVARAYFAQSRRIIRQSATMEFSAWRYLKVTPIDFDSDLDDLDGLAIGQRVIPLFMRTAN